MLEVSHVVRKYGALTAVDDVSFEVEKGEVVGLLGHNGAGKTTIMKMLTGYLEANTGSISIHGHPINQKHLLAKKSIGYLPEQSPLYPDMSVISYLKYVAELRGIARKDQPDCIREALQKTGLVDKSGDRIQTLSRGYKQRLGVAQAIMHKPELLILDEPTNGLDPDQIVQMRALLQELRKHATVLLSTHILQEVQAVCDRVIIINKGRIAIDAPLASLQATNKLSVTCDADPDEGTSVFQSIQGIQGVAIASAEEGKATYSLALDQEHGMLTPKIVKTVVERGWNVYEVSPERRTLEKIFSEVNEQGVSHGN